MYIIILSYTHENKMSREMKIVETVLSLGSSHLAPGGLYGAYALSSLQIEPRQLQYYDYSSDPQISDLVDHNMDPDYMDHADQYHDSSFDPQISDLVDHNMDPDYMDHADHYHDSSFDPQISDLVDHNMDPDYMDHVDQYHDSSFDPQISDLVDHNMDPDYMDQDYDSSS
jgi:hypothetical protein